MFAPFSRAERGEGGRERERERERVCSYTDLADDTIHFVLT